MKKVIKTVCVTIGLPGSGKTNWSKLESQRTERISYYNKKFIHVVDVDSIPDLMNKEKYIKERFESYFYNTDIKTVILDGLFLGHQDVVKFISLIDKRDLPHIILSLEYWVPDIDACLHNDKGRRNVNSEITIKNSVVDEVNKEYIQKLKEEFPTLKDIKMNKHTVERKPDWEVFAAENGLYYDENGIVKGSSWSMGGTSGSCWDSQINTVSGEPGPEGFPELDELLERICPQLGFLQYKSIYRECVSSDIHCEGDYYGGSVTYGQKSFNVAGLYESLKSRDLLTKKFF